MFSQSHLNMRKRWLSTANTWSTWPWHSATMQAKQICALTTTFAVVKSLKKRPFTRRFTAVFGRPIILLFKASLSPKWQKPKLVFSFSWTHTSMMQQQFQSGTQQNHASTSRTAFPDLILVVPPTNSSTAMKATGDKYPADNRGQLDTQSN